MPAKYAEVVEVPWNRPEPKVRAKAKKPVLVEVPKPESGSTDIVDFEQCKGFTAARDHLSKLAPLTTGLCQGGLFKHSGELWHKSHGYCHSWLSYGFRYSEPGSVYSGRKDQAMLDKPFLFANSHKSASFPQIRKEASDAFVLWMCDSKSWFYPYILNRDDKEFLKEGGPILLCGDKFVQHSAALYFAKALRYAKEGSQSVQVWYELVQRGVPPEFAFIVCSSACNIKNNIVETNIQVTGHVSVHTDIGFKSAYPKRAMTWDIDNNTSGVSASVFGRVTGGPSIGLAIRSLGNNMTKDDGWGGKIRINGLEFDVLADHCKTWIKEHNIG